MIDYNLAATSSPSLPEPGTVPVPWAAGGRPPARPWTLRSLNLDTCLACWRSSRCPPGSGARRVAAGPAALTAGRSCASCWDRGHSASGTCTQAQPRWSRPLSGRQGLQRQPGRPCPSPNHSPAAHWGHWSRHVVRLVMAWIRVRTHIRPTQIIKFSLPVRPGQLRTDSDPPAFCRPCDPIPHLFKIRSTSAELDICLQLFWMSRKCHGCNIELKDNSSDPSTRVSCCLGWIWCLLNILLKFMWQGVSWQKSCVLKRIPQSIWCVFLWLTLLFDRIMWVLSFHFRANISLLIVKMSFLFSSSEMHLIFSGWVKMPYQSVCNLVFLLTYSKKMLECTPRTCLSLRLSGCTFFPFWVEVLFFYFCRIRWVLLQVLLGCFFSSDLCCFLAHLHSDSGNDCTCSDHTLRLSYSMLYSSVASQILAVI